MANISTIKQEVFAQEVAAGRSHREAAIHAGYSQHSASCLGSQLMNKPRVRARVLELRQRTKGSLHRVAVSPASVLLDDDGNVVGIYVTLEPGNFPGSAQAAAIEEIRTAHAGP
jgi:Terminase small subunit